MLRRGTVIKDLIPHDSRDETVPPHQFLEEFSCGFVIGALCNKGFQHFTFVVYGAPNTMLLAIDLHENLIKMPAPVARPQRLNPLFPDLGSKPWTDRIPPEPYRFVADINAALMHQILAVAHKESGNQMYSIAVRRMISGLVLE